MERIVIISEVDAIVQMRILEEKTLAPGEKGVKFIQSAEMPENFYEAVAKFEAAHIDQMIHLCDGDVAKAAELQGLDLPDQEELARQADLEAKAAALPPAGCENCKHGPNIGQGPCRYCFFLSKYERMENDA
jgi:hypothetical protein